MKSHVPGSARTSGRALKLAARLLFAFLVSPAVGRAHEAGAARFEAHEELGWSELVAAVERGAADLAPMRGELAVRESEARGARLLPNPELDTGWGTIPVGETNPPDLARPFARVPNYSVGLAYTFPVGKRKPRRERADALVSAAQAELEAAQRSLALSLADVLGELAALELRKDGLLQLVASGERSVELAEARVRAQFGAPLEVDQMRIELDRTTQQLAAVESDHELALASCARFVGGPCSGFRDRDAAHAFLTRWTARARELSSSPPKESLEARADLRALRAYASAARSEAELAHAERLPDPTVRLGYVHDRFLESGAHRNSFNVSLGVPLPLFDRGQTRERAAEATRIALEEQRALRVATREARLPALERRLAISSERCDKLGGDVIPRARGVLENLDRNIERRLLPITQAIQARRVLSELLLEEADSCADAYRSMLELMRERPLRGSHP